LAVGFHYQRNLAICPGEIGEREPMITRQRRHADLAMLEKLPITGTENDGAAAGRNFLTIRQQMNRDLRVFWGSRYFAQTQPPIECYFAVRIIGHD